MQIKSFRLREDQVEKLSRLAKEKKLSESEIIRKQIDKLK